MYIRVNNQIFQGTPTFGSDVLYVRIASDSLTYSDIENMFNGETIEFLNDAQTEITRKYWIKRLAAVSIANQNPRTFEVTLDVSSVGDGAVEGMQSDISDAGDALIELAEMAADNEERITAVEAYNERITTNTESLANLIPLVNDCIHQIETLNGMLTTMTATISRLDERVTALENGGAN